MPRGISIGSDLSGHSDDGVVVAGLAIVQVPLNAQADRHEEFHRARWERVASAAWRFNRPIAPLPLRSLAVPPDRTTRQLGRETGNPRSSAENRLQPTWRRPQTSTKPRFARMRN